MTWQRTSRSVGAMYGRRSGRVLYASPSDGIHDRRFVEAWATSGFEVEQVTLGDHLVGTGTMADSLRESWARFRPDVTQVGPLSAPAALACTDWAGPLIATSWGFDLLRDIQNDAGTRDEVSNLLTSADGLLVDNDAGREVAVRLGMLPSLIHMFPWGVDLVRFSPEGPHLRASLGLAEDAFVITSIRTLEPEYSVKTLVQAYAAILPSWPQAHLLIAGEGSERGPLEGLANALGLDSQVTFLGTQSPDQLARLLCTSDLYVSTSPVDGSSVSLLEAMASGVPACVTDIPGNRQWIDNTRGAIFPPGDSVSLAKCLSQLLELKDENAEGWKEMGASARQTVQAHADWSATVGRFPSFAESAQAHFRGRRR